MKAEITESGELIITPRNKTESYALKKWWKGWTEKGEETIRVNLNVDFNKKLELNYKCGDCGKTLTEVRPGKHQCDNTNCKQK